MLACGTDVQGLLCKQALVFHLTARSFPPTCYNGQQNTASSRRTVSNLEMSFNGDSNSGFNGPAGVTRKAIIVPTLVILNLKRFSITIETLK